MIRRFHLWSASDLIALDDLWVRPEARDKGVGRELMHAVADLAAPERLAIVWGARADNEAAHRFYLRLGAAMTTKAMFSWRPAS
jgi:ribosomal protein S18 acetylase RimI-like enzyme